MATKSRSLLLWVVVVVGLAASACAEEFGDPTATFDGSVCRFAGPSDLDFNISIPFVFANESDREAGMEIWKVPDGTRIEDVVEGDIDEIADLDTDMRGTVQASGGESATVSVLLDVPGDWLISCFTDSDYPAVIFQVFDEEATG